MPRLRGIASDIPVKSHASSSSYAIEGYWLTYVEDSKYAGTYRDQALGRMSFGHCLQDSLEAAIELRPATRALYDTEARLYVLPALGHVPVAAIRPQDVRALLAELLDAGKGAQTLSVVRRLVSRALSQAVADGLIASNPAARVATPRIERPPIRILDVAEVETLADAIDRRYRAAVLLGAYGGLRFGEIVALRRPALRLLECRVDVTEGATEVRGNVVIGAQDRRLTPHGHDPAVPDRRARRVSLEHLRARVLGAER